MTALRRERDALAAQNERLRHLLAKLSGCSSGGSRSGCPRSSCSFAFEELEASIAANEAEAEKRSPELRRKRAEARRAGRGRLPAHLPRVEVVLEPEDTACPCCRGAMAVIGHDTSERLDVIPAQFRVLVTRRPKLACRACAGVVVQAPAPERLIEGGMPTEATVAQVLVSRYADHLPLYRQSQILARQGIEIGRDTLASWVGTRRTRSSRWWRGCARSCSARRGCSPTRPPCRCSTPGRGRTKKGFAWAIARDDRPWGGAEPPAVVFRYAPGRGAGAREGAARRLRRHPAVRRLRGLQERLHRGRRGPLWRSAGPMSRREFFDLAKGGTAPIAEEALRRIAALYAIEAEVRGKPPDMRRAGAPGEEPSRWSRTCSPGSRRSWRACRAAPDRGGDPLRAEPSRGPRAVPRRRAHRASTPTSVERAIRPLVLSRKNALFASGDDGGARWAAVASLVETCKLNGVDPQRYFTDVLTRLVNGWPQSRIDELMPWHWATAKNA